MLAVGLIGIIASAALAPLVFTVNSLEDAQKQWGGRLRESTAFDKIFKDVRSSIQNPSFVSFKTVRKSSAFAEDDDRLLVWTASSLLEGYPVSLVVYKVCPRGVGNETSGLYRWVLKGVKSAPEGTDLGKNSSHEQKDPMCIDTDALNIKDARLVMPDAQGVKFQVKQDKEWISEYEGVVPKVLKVEIILKDKRISREEWFSVVN